MLDKQNKYYSLCENIGYHFKNVQHLVIALTHKSYGQQNNERLEFLGDSILNFIISDILYSLPAGFNEGELTSCRAFLVRGETLMELAEEFNLHEFMLVGVTERRKKQKNKGSMFANAIEAILGAIYLDSDIEQCKKVVSKWYEKRIMHISPQHAKDAKTRLQEFAQSQGYNLPVYKIIDIEGLAHEQSFTASCEIIGLPGLTEGVGASKRKAEQAAATNYLELIDDE